MILSALSFDGGVPLNEKYYLFTWSSGKNYISGKLSAIILFLDFHAMNMSWQGRCGVYLQLYFVVQVLWSELHHVITLFTTRSPDSPLFTVSVQSKALRE